MKKIVKRVLIGVPLGLVGLVLLSVLLFLAWNLVFPRLSGLRTHNPASTAFMEYRQAQWEAKGVKHGLTHRWAPLSRISPYLANAVIISEDDKFWQHKGFDWQAIKEAYERNARRKEVHFGGSTITQQLVKNLFLSPSRNLIRKAREAILTWRLERVLTKKRILELYLNVVEWGDGIYGAEAASAYYFQKPASDLSADESARLAAILPIPRRYTPLKIRTSAYLARRSEEILAVMEKRGLIRLEDEAPAIPPQKEPELVEPPAPPIKDTGDGPD
jgi:monofunctional biosynthetic peptidoglycan transglycosylase